MRKALIAAAITAAMLIPATAASAGRWDTQVTGGATFSSFDLDISSRQDADGAVKGQIQYTRHDASLVMHIDVDCVSTGANGYAFSGPSKIQEGSYPSYVSVEVSFDGDKVRVRDVARGDSECGYSGSYPATVIDGGYNIK